MTISFLERTVFCESPADPPSIYSLNSFNSSRSTFEISIFIYPSKVLTLKYPSIFPWLSFFSPFKKKVTLSSFFESLLEILFNSPFKENPYNSDVRSIFSTYTSHLSFAANLSFFLSSISFKTSLYFTTIHIFSFHKLH